MDLTQYSLSVVERTSVPLNDDGVGVIDIAAILAIVIPLLSMLPCLKDKTPVTKRQFVEDHPRLAISETAQEIRKQARGKGEKIVRKESKRYATTIVNDYLSTPDNEIQLMGISL